MARPSLIVFTNKIPTVAASVPTVAVQRATIYQLTALNFIHKTRLDRKTIISCQLMLECIVYTLENYKTLLAC